MIRGGSSRIFQKVSLTLKEDVLLTFKEDVLLTFTKVIYKSALQNCSDITIRGSKQRHDDRPRIVTTYTSTNGGVCLVDHTRKGHQLSMMEHGFLRVVSLTAVATLVSSKQFKQPVVR